MASAYDRIKASRRKFHESAGLTDQDIANFQQNYVASQDGAQLVADLKTAEQNLINSPATVRDQHKALADYASAMDRVSTFVGLGGQAPGADSAYLQRMQEQYAQAWNNYDSLVKANRQGFGSLGMQTAAGIAPNGAQFDREPLSQHLKPGRGLIDFNTGYPTESNQRAAQENAMRTQYQNIQTEAGQESARWGQQAAAAQTDKERADYWLNIISGLPVTNDARIKTSNDEWMRQAAQDLGIDSYIDRDDLLRKIRVKSTAAGASGTVATRRAEDYAGQQRAARAYEYQLDNPNESIEANYYLAMRDQAARDIQNVDSFADYFDTKGAVGDWLRYNSAYGDQLYQDQKNEEILAIRSDPNVGPVYQEAMEASRGAGEVANLRAQAHGEMRETGSISAQTETAIRELAARYGITVGQGDAALESALEQMHQQNSRNVNVSMARLQAQGYDPERLRQYIQQALNDERMDAQNVEAREYADEHPVAATLGSSLTNVLSGGGYISAAPQAIGNAISGVTGNYDNYIPIDTNSVGFDQAQYVMAVRDEVTKNIQENGGTGFLYGVGTSMLDNVVQMAVGAALMGGAGAVTGQGARAAIQSGMQSAATASLATMGLSAASQELVRLTEQGVSSDQAFALATVKGAVEIVTEKIGIDNFVANLGKKSTGNFVQQLVSMAAQQSAAEGGEEIIAEVAGLYADWLILQEESDIAKTIEAGRLNGMTESEALWDAFEKYALQVLEAGAAGAVSGLGFGAMSTAGMVVDAVSPAATGARIRAEGNEPVLGMMASAYGLEYDESMTDRQIGKVYREVQRQADRVVKDMQYGISMESYAREKGYDTKTAKALSRSWNAYRTVDGNNMSSREFAATWNSVKAAGQANMSFDNAVAELGETTLSRYTLESAWKAGQRLYAQAQKTAKAQPVKPQETVQQENVPEVKLDTEIGEGVPAQTELVQRTSEKAATYAQQLMGERINVNGLSDEAVESFYDKIDSDIATERQGALAMARMLTGVSKNISQVIFVDSASYDAEGRARPMSNGMWDPTNRTMTIDINAGRMNVEQQMTFMTRAMSHEITHSIKTTAREQYDELSRFVLREMDKQHNLEALIEAKIKDYASEGVELDREGAIDELVAEACEQMLERTYVLKRLARENRSLWEKIRDFFKAAIEKLRSLYKNLAPNSTEAKLMQGVINELQAKWDAAFAASLTAEATETSAAAQHSIAGRNAAIADIIALDEAKQMEVDGYTEPEIYQQTGWFRGADNMWRFEIDDSTMRYYRAGDAKFRKDHPGYVRYQELMEKFLYGDITEDEAQEMRESDYRNEYNRLKERVDRGNAHLDDILDHDTLFAAYPALRDVRIEFAEAREGLQGVYRRRDNKIVLSEKLRREPEATLIHEIQHVIQSMEGFAFGASRAYWKEIIDNGGKIDSKRLRDATAAVRKFENSPGNKEIVDARNRLNSAWEEGAKAGSAMYAQLEAEGIAEKVDAYEDMLWEQSNAGVAFLNSTPMELYQNTAGEQEARDVAERRTMTSEQRKGKMPQTGTKDTVFAEGSSVSASDSAMKPSKEIQFSLARNEELSALAKAANDNGKAVPDSILAEATRVRQKIADMMRENISKYGNSYGLPPDLEGDTFLADGSYGGSEENTTLCVRSMAHEAMLDAVSEMLGRPLTVQESIFVGQDLLSRTNIGMRMECTYCYVATDRKGYREFLGKYLAQRDAVLKKYRNGMTDTSRSGKLYKEFLNKRKDTDNMWERFSMWIDLEKTGAPMMQSHHLANVSKIVRGDYDQELKPQIEDAMKYAQGASWAKKRMNYTAYNGHILKWTADRIRALNSHYGLRMYSFSDFSPAFILENMQMFVDAAVRGLKVLAYTKELDFVKIFAKTGANINISCFGMEVNGVIAEDRIQGAAWAEAQKLREENPNVGITFVATNDALVEWALAQEWIDVVIPFHLVRTGKELAKQLGFEDYTKESADKKVRGKHISQKKAAAMGIEADESSISPVGHDNDFDKYMAALEKNHLKPRFERWIKNPNYMKLVNECRQSASESKPVQPIFELDEAETSLNSLIGQGGYYVPYGKSVERQYEIAADIADKISAGEADAAAKQAQIEWDEKHPKKPSKSKKQHQISRDTASNMDLLMGASMDGLSKAEADHLLRYRDRVNEIRQNQRKIDELKAEELTADINAQIKLLENANSIIYRKVSSAEKTKLMQGIIERERTAGDVELERIENRISDLEEELDELERAKLAGRMHQVEIDAKTYIKRENQLIESKRRALERARASRDKKISEMRESRANEREARKRSVLVHKIRNVANDLRQRTLRPTDGKYVPSYLTRAVIDVANMIDDAPGEGTKARAKYDSMQAALRNLRYEYDNLEKDKDPDYNSEYDREFAILIDELANAIGDTAVKDMTYEQVEDVYSVLRDIRITLIDAVHQIGSLDRRTNYDTGVSIIEEMQAVAPRKKVLGDIKTKMDGLAMSPLRNVHKMTGYREDSTLMALFDDLNNGIRRQNKFVMEANQIFDPLREGKLQNTFAAACNDVVDFELLDIDGKPVKMTRMDAMQIVLSFERERANEDLIHMEANPVNIADPVLMRKGKVREAISQGQMVWIGLEQIKMIESKLTEWDKQFMDKAREMFNGKAKDAINEMSRLLKHRNLATGKAYIPFHVDQNFVDREIEGVKVDSTIEGAGSLKSLSKKATQPLIITGLNHVIDDHIGFVGKYYGLAVPIRNFNKAYNIKKVGSTLSVKSAIDNVWGRTGLDVIASAVRDLQKSRERATDALSKGLQALQSGFVKAALLSNVSVTIKQASSYYSAGLHLSPLALGRYQAAVPRLFAAPNGSYAKNLYAEIDKHTAQHWIRRQGMSTQELGENAQRKGKLADFERKLPASLNPVKWIQNMDVATTGALWLACKKEIQNSGEFELNSEEYWDAVTELYDRTIEETQGMYDVLHRPEVQKTTNELVRQLIMFRTEPLQHSGLIYDSFGELAAAKKSGDEAWRKRAVLKARRAVFSQLVSMTVFAAMTMIAGIVTHRLDRYRDEDEELTFLSVMFTMLGDLGQDAMGKLIPVGGSELYDVIVNKLIGSSRFETVSVPVVGVINDYVDALTTVRKAFEEQFEADEPDWKAAWATVYELGKETAELFGIPVTNVQNILVGTYKNAVDIANGYFPAFNNNVERADGVNYRRLYQALESGDDDKFDEVYGDLMQSLTDGGDENAERTIASGLQQEIREAYLDGDLTYEDATRLLTGYTIVLSDTVEQQHNTGTISDEEYLKMLEDEAYWTIKGWDTNAVDSDASTAKYADLQAVIEAGGDGTAAIEELLEHGETEKEIRSGASGIIADLYKNGEIDADTAEEYLAEYAGITDSKDLYTWFTEKDHWVETGENDYGAYGPVWDALMDGGDVNGAINAMVKAGWTEKEVQGEVRKHVKIWVLGTGDDGYTISTTEAQNILSKYGGVSDDDMVDYLNAYEFWLEDPGRIEMYDFDQAVAYAEHGEGIDEDVFFGVRDAYANSTGIPDGKGGVVDGSKKAEVMAYIDELPITDAQKDQLYLMYWKESRIYEAPWH